MHTRRTFLQSAAGCAGYLASGLAGLSAGAARAFARQGFGDVVAESTFARIERIAEGVWAVVSTPLKNGERHFETTANGGIVAGHGGTGLLIEGYMSDAGAAWVLEAASALTGSTPRDAVVTHFHGDHCNGLGGLGAAANRVFATEATRALLREGDAAIVPGGVLHGPSDAPHRLVFGERHVEVTARKGHTPSDATIHVADAEVVFAGDLVWNGMFPNFTHSIPSHMVRHCEELLADPARIIVPGHGDVSDAAGLAPYLGLLHDLEEAANGAHAAGTSASDAAAEYRIPATLGTYVQFGDDYIERAFRAWERELGGDQD